jgi:hypothetical protein
LGELRARWNSCVYTALRAIRDDDEMHLMALSSIPSKHRADRALVVRMRRYDE